MSLVLLLLRSVIGAVVVVVAMIAVGYGTRGLEFDSILLMKSGTIVVVSVAIPLLLLHSIPSITHYQRPRTTELNFCNKTDNSIWIKQIHLDR